MPLLGIGAVALFLLWNAAGAAWAIGGRALAGGAWEPWHGRFGTAPLVAGTLAVSGLALALAIPVALGSATYLALHAGGRFRAAARAFIGLLSGMPSVVIGLWGVTWVVPSFGNSWLSASIVLALMIVPTITLLAEAALRLVPHDLLDSGRALGLSDTVLARMALRHARWGIVGAIVLGASRALGEAIAVCMVAGNVAGWPSLHRPIATLTTTLIVELDGAASVHRNALYLLGCLVLAAVAALSLLGRSAQRHAGS